MSCYIWNETSLITKSSACIIRGFDPLQPCPLSLCHRPILTVFKGPVLTAFASQPEQEIRCALEKELHGGVGSKGAPTLWLQNCLSTDTPTLLSYKGLQILRL